ncbi:hypothetical protein [Metabacillus schmidteae]|uniref:hypothetical protein n=1 Tax=Metabacillus schmidteae TaxID=2730405 RepID=UPI00158A672E|nr:hypothetical protein [Metabacillus schmidteae]
MSKEEVKPTYYDGSGSTNFSPAVHTSDTYIIKPDYDKETLVKYPYFPYKILVK